MDIRGPWIFAFGPDKNREGAKEWCAFRVAYNIGDRNAIYPAKRMSGDWAIAWHGSVRWSQLWLREQVYRACSHDQHALVNEQHLDASIILDSVSVDSHQTK